MIIFFTPKGGWKAGLKKGQRFVWECDGGVEVQEGIAMFVQSHSGTVHLSNALTNNQMQKKKNEKINKRGKMKIKRKNIKQKRKNIKKILKNE